MNKFPYILNGEKGWKNEKAMLKDIADFRIKRLVIVSKSSALKTSSIAL